MRGSAFGYLLLVALLAMGGVAVTALFVTYVGSNQQLEVATARLDSPVTMRRGTSARPLGAALVFAVTPVIGPREMFASWQAVATLLSERIGATVQLQQRRSYEEVNGLLERGEAQIALLCSGPYVHLRRRGVVRLLAMPEVHGSTVYHSYIIARSDLPVVTWEELRGKSFAFSDPLSNSGSAYPRYVLSQAGYTPQSFFSRTVNTYGHDRSILAVARGVVDAAAVDSLVFDDMIERDPSLAKRVRIVHRSMPFGINPVVVGRSVTPAQADRIRRALIAMPSDPRGRAALAAIGIDGFREPDPAAYNSVEAITDALARARRVE